MPATTWATCTTIKCSTSTAIEYWERSAELNPDFAITWRNLSLAYYNKRHDQDKARQAMERAYELNPGDARIFLELDQLYKSWECRGRGAFGEL